MRLPNTLNILTGRKLAGTLKEDIMKEVVVQLGDVDSILTVQIGYEIVRVTFCCDEAFSRAKSVEGVSLFGLWCKILGGGPATTLVHVFDYPFEESDVEIEHALADFGEVKRSGSRHICRVSKFTLVPDWSPLFSLSHLV